MSNVQKSFVTMGLAAVLSNVTNSVIEAEKTAKSSKEIQTMHILRPGLRQDIFIGTLMVIPPSIMDDADKIPLPLFKGAVVNLFSGEEASALESHRLAETEFDMLGDKEFAVFKDKLFKDEEGKLGCLCVFLPAWANPRDYAGFRFVKDSEKLEQLIRHLVFGAYFRPSLSAMFDILEENQLKLDVAHIEHDHMGGFTDLLSNSNTYPVLESGAGEMKVASKSGRKPFIRFAASEIDAIKGEVLSKDEQAVMDQLTNDIVNKAASLVDNEGASGIENTPDALPRKKRVDEAHACRKCHESLDGNKSEYYCDKCNMPLKKYSTLDDTINSSMVRFGEEPEDEQTITEAPSVMDEGMVDRIAADAEMAIADNYLAEGDALDRVENVDDEAYEQALEIAIYEAMEKNKVPYHEAEELAKQVKARIMGQYAPEEVVDEVEIADEGLTRDLDNFYDGTIDSTEFESQPHAFTSSVEKMSMMDFFNKCERCGALTSVPPGSEPEGHGTICADCAAKPAEEAPMEVTSDYDPNYQGEQIVVDPLDRSYPEMTADEFDALKEHHNQKAMDWEQAKAKTKLAEKEEKYFEVERKDMEKPTLKLAEKAVEYFDVVREEVTLPEGEPLMAKDEFNTEGSREAISPEQVDGPQDTPKPSKKDKKEPKKEEPKKEEPKKEEPKKEEPKKEEVSGKQGGLKNRGSLRPKQALTYNHPGDALEKFAPEQLDGVALHPEFSGEVEAPDLKLNPKSSSHKIAFDWMAPGQVLKEFYPDVLNQMMTHEHEDSDYHPVSPDEELREEPTKHNEDITRNEVDADEKHSLTSPGLVSTESGGGTPLRSLERNIRGPFFADQFYKIHADISPANLTIKSSLNKFASEIDAPKIVADFLAKLSAEIASTLLAAFMVTESPSFVGVPTSGTIDLDAVTSGQMISPLLASGVVSPLAAQLRSLLEGMNDSELTNAINDAWAQSAVWKDSGTSSFLYEVFVRIEAVDTTAMVVTYKFVTGLKEK